MGLVGLGFELELHNKTFSLQALCKSLATKRRNVLIELYF